MYAGKLLELAEVYPLFDDPLNPYTRGLLNSVPNISLTEDHLQIMDGSPPDLISPPPGCRVHPRCPYAKQECSRREPAMKNVGKDRLVACWLY